GLYNLQAVIRFTGPLLAPALRWSLHRIAQRHETLRTAFVVDGHDPAQTIAAAAASTLPIIDLAGLPPERRAAEVRRLSVADRARPFDLRRAPLLRTTLICVDERAHVLLLTVHHIVFDGESMGVLMRELREHYEWSSGQRPRTSIAPLP